MDGCFWCDLSNYPNLKKNNMNKEELRQAFPLDWPLGYKRTASRSYSRFKQTGDDAQRFLRNELSKIGARNIIVSSNVPVRKDGMMYSEHMNKVVTDPGVAVYFNLNGEAKVIVADQFTRVWENIYAIGKTLESMRAIERYGASDFINRAFKGFTALPEAIETPYKREWWVVLGVDKHANSAQIKEAYRIKSKLVHPDKGGTAAQFQEMQDAYREAMAQFD
jgi:hypothetical protein